MRRTFLYRLSWFAVGRFCRQSPGFSRLRPDRCSAGRSRGAWATVHAASGVEFHAEINGRGPFDVVLDTGSANIVSTSLATHPGLKLEVEEYAVIDAADALPLVLRCRR
jgi:hypothetical protein